MRFRTRVSGPTIVVAVATAIAAGVSAGPPPPNDLCGNAELVSGPGPFAFDNTAATSDGPNDSIACDAFGSMVIDADVWFEWVADCDGPVTLETCGGTGVDTKIAVYDGACPTGRDEEIACNDDTCGLQSSVIFEASAGSTYFLRIGTFPGAAGGTGSFDLFCGTVGCQYPDQLGHGGAGFVGTTSDRNPGADVVVAEDMLVTETGSITAVSWWGFYLDFDLFADCAPGPGDDFAITYFNDDAGGAVPGTLRAGPFDVPANAFQTGNIINSSAGDLNEFQFEANHPPVNVTGGECIWIEISNNTVGSCFWLWQSAPPGDGRIVQIFAGEPQYQDFDVALCLDVDVDPLACGPLPPVENDLCGDASPIIGYGDFPFDNFAAATDGPPSPDCKVDTASDVWFCWTAGCDGSAIISTCGGAAFDTTLEVYEGCACPPQSSALLACNDDQCDLQSQVVVPVIGGLDYLVRVGKVAGSIGGGAGVITIAPGEDCNNNGQPDFCEVPDCNGNGLPDECDIGSGFSFDCNGNGIPDECDLDNGLDTDCNLNFVLDSCDIAGGFSADTNGNGVPDECEPIVFRIPPDEFNAGGPCIFNAVGEFDGFGFDGVAGAGMTLDTVVIIPGPTPLDVGAVQVFRNQGTTGSTWNGFEDPPDPPIIVGRDPTGVALGFFDGDAFTDMAVTDAGDNDVRILINDGAGGFTLTQTIPLGGGASPQAIASGDVNGDGFTDLVIVNGGTGTLVLAENSDTSPGTFAVTAPAVTVGLGPRSVCPEDVDEDKDLDLVVANAGDDTVAIVENLGLGALDPSPMMLAVGATPTGLKVVDIDGDGFRDIVTTNSGSNTISVLHNTTEVAMPISFATQQQVMVGANPRAVDAADFDGDLDPDLAIVADDPQIGGPAVIIIVNSSTPENPSFQARLAFDTNAEPRSLRTGDFDDDSVPDVATANFDNGAGMGIGSVTVLRVDLCPMDANGDGTVNVSDLVDVIVSWGPCPDCPADVNRDGEVDVNDLIQVIQSWGGCP